MTKRIKGTPGITGLSRPRVRIDDAVWHLDVGSSHPGAAVGPKGWAALPLKLVRELGLERRKPVRSLSAVGVGNLRRAVPSMTRPGWTNL